MDREAVLHYIGSMGATFSCFFPPEFLVPEERIRKYCLENKCGCYGKHLMCPPIIGGISELTEKLKQFDTAILLQYEKKLDVKNDREGLTETKLRLHHMVLKTEKYLKEQAGIRDILGTIGGDCSLCVECAGFRGEPCQYPQMARPSMEALGVDVISLLKRLSLDGDFHDDKITWTAIILTAS